MADLVYSEGIIQRLSQYLRHIITLKDIGKELSHHKTSVMLPKLTVQKLEETLFILV